MKVKLLLLLVCVLTTLLSAYAQHPSRVEKDTSSRPGGELVQKPEKGPNKGKMMRSGELKVEMVTPGNLKKPEVMYYVYDSLNHMLDAKLFTGTVKYVFGGPNQYLQVKLLPVTSGKNNQYVATLEDWKDYKMAIVTMKGNGQAYNFVFLNTLPVRDQSGGNQSGGQQNSGGGMNPGMNGGGMNPNMNNGGGMMNPGRGY
jgi:hypothetical protein